MERTSQEEARDGQLLCQDPRCRNVLPGGAEICDECGAANLRPLADVAAVLMASHQDHMVAFPLQASRPNMVGRAAEGEPSPDVDLGRLAGSDSVHRQHAIVELGDGAWTIAHRGRNPVVLRHGGSSTLLEPGATAVLESGDRLTVGRVSLRFQVTSGQAP